MTWIKKYADLLSNYSLFLKEGELVYLRTTCLAQDLVRDFSQSCIDRSVNLVVEFDYEEKEEYLIANGNNNLLNYLPSSSIDLIQKCDAYLYIRAPYIPNASISIDPQKEKIRSQALMKFQEIYFERLGNGTLKRSLCQFPTLHAANLAGMSLGEYENFIVKACYLDKDDPEAYWKDLSKFQQTKVDYLNKTSQIVYEHTNWRIMFEVKGRTWINSDGKSNMPSGEVFTSPIENSVQGEIYFNYTSTVLGSMVQGIHLKVKDGYIQEYHAETGQEVLDRVFEIEGSRYFGEVAIGTNMNIQRATNNILFDEKIGGSIHMAVGQSYYQCGGKNKSSIHWDLITDMKQGGRIYADEKIIYENGVFII
ncbi:MAG: aminopeptidase [Saprospiraceae bacterium]